MAPSQPIPDRSNQVIVGDGGMVTVRSEKVDPVAMLNQLGAKWSPDLGDYATGKLGGAQIRCVLCSPSPCECQPFSRRREPGDLYDVYDR